MLQYLIKITNNSLSAVLMTALLLSVALRLPLSQPHPGRIKPSRMSLVWALAAGFAAALVYAILKRTTGFAVREYYDLGVLLLSVAASVPLLLTVGWALSAGVFGAIFRLFAFCSLATWSAYFLPNILLYPFEFAVGMDTIF
ncbi:MAG: hypothetical protein LBT15_02495, partial [Synergistaceae bacterium]|nr:hypothetical protein [Synergistaceae bacterium]